MSRFSSSLAIVLCASLAACSYMPTWMGGRKDTPPPLPGERITVLAVDSALKVDEAVKSVPVTLPAAFSNAEWPQHSGVFSAGQGNLASLAGFTSETSGRVGEGEEFEHTLVTRPVVGGGLVFAMDAAGHVSAHDAANVGSVRWQSKGLSEEDESDILGGGLAYDQGKLYGVSGRGLLAAWDAISGKELWKRNMQLPFRSAPRIAGDKLFATTIDSQTYAISTATGQPVWNHRGMEEIAELMNSVSPTVAGDTVVVPYGSGEIYALSAVDGRELWNESLAINKRTLASGVFTGIGGDPVIDGDVVFAVSNSGLLSVLHLARGQKVWERPIASMNTPWVAGNFLFLLTTDNTLVCFLKYEGHIRWVAQLPSYEDMEEKRRPIVWHGPVLANGNLYVVGSSGEMKVISASDGSMSSRSIPSGIQTAPVIAGGRMYLVGQNATLYSLQ